MRSGDRPEVEVPSKHWPDPSPIFGKLVRPDKVLSLFLLSVVGSVLISWCRSPQPFGRSPAQLSRPESLAAVAVNDHDIAGPLHGAPENPAMMMVIRRSAEDSVGVAPALPIGIGRSIEAAGMDSDGVAVILQARLIHPLQINQVVHGPRWVLTRGGESAADDDGSRVFSLDGLIGCGQELDVAIGIQRFIAPFIVQVLLVPDLVGLDPALVALGQGRDEIGQVLRVCRWTIMAEVRVARSGPLWRFDYTEENLKSGRLAIVYQSVNFSPVVLALASLIILPLDLLLYPAEAQILDRANDRAVVLVNEVGLDAVVET